MAVSSSCVYPDAAPVPTPELDAFVAEPEEVNAGYGWAKRIQELACGYFSREHGMKITILRPFNLYGANYPWRSMERAHVIPSLVKRVLDGEDPLVVEMIRSEHDDRRCGELPRLAVESYRQILLQRSGPIPKG